MILFKWLAEARKRRSERRRIDGYDYAAGVLLRAASDPKGDFDECVRDLDSELLSDHRSEFDAGMQQAIADAIRLVRRAAS